MPPGRPTRYKKRYCKEIIEHCKTGLSFESFAGVIGVHKDTIYEWCKKYPEFSDAKKRAASISLLWWEKEGIDGLRNEYQGGSFNTANWIFNMRNRFKWTNRDTVDENEGDGFEFYE